MGACNCGHLAQELTNFSKAEIHQYAMQKHGDWNQQLLDYCPTSGYPIDLMISKMLEFGLSLNDLAHLEKLSDPTILSEIPKERRELINKNSREDVVLYMKSSITLSDTQRDDYQTCEDSLSEYRRAYGRLKTIIII
jgi:hypothetical protein